MRTYLKQTEEFKLINIDIGYLQFNIALHI